MVEKIKIFNEHKKKMLSEIKKYILNYMEVLYLQKIFTDTTTVYNIILGDYEKLNTFYAQFYENKCIAKWMKGNTPDTVAMAISR